MRSTAADDETFDHDAVDTPSSASSTPEESPSMKALLLFTRLEGILTVSQAVEIAEVPKPVVSSNSLVIQIRAAAMSLEDLYTAIGRRPLLHISPTPTNPVIPGIDFVGRVADDAAAASCKDFKAGDVVMGCLPPVRVRHGTWAQYLVISPNNITKVPTNWTRSQAAAFGMSALVAHAAIQIVFPENTTTTRKQVLVGVVGASGCIGSLIVMLLAHKGAHVVAVCSEENSTFCKEQLGASHVATRESGGLACYRANDEGRNDKRPLDYVIDCVGGNRVEQDAAKALKKGGHFITTVGHGPEPFGEGASGGIGRGAVMAAKALRSRMVGDYSYTLVSASPFGIASKLENMANQVNQCTDGKGPPMRTNTVAANDMIAVREALDSVAKHTSGGRVILDFSVFDE
jgi:NADPH:quinone reductase-like Zn-dependent oxidoreductase